MPPKKPEQRIIVSSYVPVPLRDYLKDIHPLIAKKLGDEEYSFSTLVAECIEAGVNAVADKYDLLRD